MIDNLTQSLMIWIGRTTERPLPPPATVALRPLTVRPSLSPLAPHRLAIYDEETRTVNLARDWDELDPIDQSVLLHALVHYTQPGSAETDCCRQARETEAYRLQALWLSQQGIDFRQAFGMSPSLIARLHLCAEMQSGRLELPSSALGVRTSRLA